MLSPSLEVGLRVVTGAALSTCAPAASPLRQAYVDYGGGVDRGRYSWDLITTHVAAAGGLPGVRRCSDCGGVNVVDASSGANAWRRGPAANQTYLVLEDAADAQRVIDRLLCQPPRLGAKHWAAEVVQEDLRDLAAFPAARAALDHDHTVA